MKFNVNQYVKVRLTNSGREILHQKHEMYCATFNLPIGIYNFFERKEDENGWSKWQLWDLMNTFGEHYYIGCKPLFDTNIEIVEE